MTKEQETKQTPAASAAPDVQLGLLDILKQLGQNKIGG
jgi:hypothetical protein